jgi:hypothetical protein
MESRYGMNNGAFMMFERRIVEEIEMADSGGTEIDRVGEDLECLQAIRPCLRYGSDTKV